MKSVLQLIGMIDTWNVKELRYLRYRETSYNNIYTDYKWFFIYFCDF